MKSIFSKKNKLSSILFIIICCALLFFSFLFFSKVKNPNWIYTGDSLNALAGYGFHYSGLVRGEYPIWNPLVRGGENEIIFQILEYAHPISNFVAISSVFLKNKDIILSYSVFLYLLILIYASGMFLLASAWTNNRYAGIFASILTLASSSIFFYAYHKSFLFLLHPIPWILYSATMYFRSFRFRYPLIFALSFCLFLYSYEFVMGLVYIIVLAVPFLIFYHREILSHRVVLKLPLRHWLTLIFILVVFLLPIFMALFQYKMHLLPISRASNITITDNYMVDYDLNFKKIFWFPLFSKYFYITLFTGFIFSGFNELRHFIGPLALPFLAVILFSFRKKALCLGISAVLICMLAGNIFPLSFLLELPILNSIRNLHFFLQFFLMTVILLAALGFDLIMSGRAAGFLKKIFNLSAVCLSFTVLLLILYAYTRPPEYLRYNIGILSVSFIGVIALLIFVNLKRLSLTHRNILVLSVSVIVSLSAYLLIMKVPVLSGALNDRWDFSGFRERYDHTLKFSMERPDNIQTLDLSGFWERFETDFGQDEYASIMTLKDNSYKTLAKGVGFSSFPLLKNYYLFSSLPGHEALLKKKFFFFDKFFLSLEPKDMLAFKDDPGLFEDMLDRGLGVIDSITQKEERIIASIGVFDPVLIKKLALADKNSFSVDVEEYKANSIRLNISTEQAGLFTYTDFWDKGWKVKVNRRSMPLKKVFYAFKGVIIPAGNHKIEFIYTNSAFWPILFMNIIFVVIFFMVAGYFLGGLFKKDKFKKE